MWYVLRELSAGVCMIRQNSNYPGFVLAAGPFQSQREALIWMNQNC